MILDKIKVSLRIRNSTKFDEDIQDCIDAAKADLLLSGVKKIDEHDPLIYQAIRYYCRANFAQDNKDSEKFQKSYESLKDKLSLCKEYQNE
ncbi:head-tail connector protein [Paeniclostridium hominis]|uniref:head-tail connector protein n=1 Tax=Paeniclostridium hominis TaxID=2764329 RepID=UPI0022E59E91|nr:head-tail connector protein [Paeniclostridium hominis]